MNLGSQWLLCNSQTVVLRSELMAVGPPVAGLFFKIVLCESGSLWCYKMNLGAIRCLININNNDKS